MMSTLVEEAVIGTAMTTMTRFIGTHIISVSEKSITIVIMIASEKFLKPMNDMEVTV